MPSNLDSTLSRHAPNSPDSASGRPLTLDSTLSRPTIHVNHPIRVHLSAQASGSVLSRRTSISSDSASGFSPHHVTPVGIQIRHSSPAPIDITNLPTPSFHPPPASITRPQPLVCQPHILQPSVLQPGIIQPSFVQPGIIQPSFVKPGIIQPQTCYPQIRHLLRGPGNMPSSYFSGGFHEMQISIQKDFRGVGMGHHRADLLQRLDHVIRQLDRGLEYFKELDPKFDEDYLQRTKHQYQYLRDILLEANMTSDQSYVSYYQSCRSVCSPPPRMHIESHTTFLWLPLPCPQSHRQNTGHPHPLLGTYLHSLTTTAILPAIHPRPRRI